MEKGIKPIVVSSHELLLQLELNLFVNDTLKFYKRETKILLPKISVKEV